MLLYILSVDVVNGRLHITPLITFKWHLRSFRVTHYVIFNVILCAFYELSDVKRRIFTTQFVKHKMTL